MTQLEPFWPHFFTTLAHRPYVFTFLFFFLLFGKIQLGWRRTLLFLGLGWLVAFTSEVSSIRNGFPYGDYQYVYENLKGEILLWGVPLWDSLSYTFLAYASFSTATLICTPQVTLPYTPSHQGRGNKESPLSPGGRGSGRGGSLEIFLQTRTSLKVLLLTVLLMAGIDVIIDPLTALGDRWFLGKIYYYPHGGIYFGVPISNFLGWALVAFVITFLFQQFDRTLHRRGMPVFADRWAGFKGWLGVSLYLGVFFFNWAITLYLKEWKLAAADLILASPLFFILLKRFREGGMKPSPSES